MSTYQKSVIAKDKEQDFYRDLNEIVKAYCGPKTHPISALANVSALLLDQIEDINWAGFYLFDGDKLIVGPFNGKPACSEIKIGSGVCGKVASTLIALKVDDVEAFPGHIACDSQSKSEMVAPLVSEEGHLLGVIDIDSPIHARFSEDSLAGLVHIAKTISKNLDWSSLSINTKV